MNKKIAIYDLETLHLLNEVSYQFDLLGFAVGAVIDYQTGEVFTFNQSIEGAQEMLYKLLEYDFIVGFNSKSFDNIVLAETTCTMFDLDNLLKKTVGFGKHKELLWEQVPDEYLEWMIRTFQSKKALAVLVHNKKQLSEPGAETISDVELLNSLNLISVDLLEHLDKYMGKQYSCSLDEVTGLTINKRKTEGIHNYEIPKLLEEGKTELVRDYCINDTQILVDLLRFVEQYGYVLLPQIRKTEKYSDLTVRVPVTFKDLFETKETEEEKQ